MVKPVETLDQIYARIFAGQKWLDGTNLTFSMTGSPATDPRYLDPDQSSKILAMSDAKKAYAADAFELWDDVINLELTQNDDPDAHIAFNYTDDTTFPYGVAITYWDASETILEGVNIWFTNAGEYADDANFQSFGTHAQNNYLHEVGHALGLAHPGAYDSSIGDPLYDTHAEYAQDTHQFSIMSYFDAGNFRDVDHIDSNGNYISPQTPMLHDILTLQRMYGADLDTRVGDTVYGFGADASGTNGTIEFDFDSNRLPVLTIWDAGGSGDRLDASGFDGDQIIDLRSGAFSSLSDQEGNGVLELTENVSIAYGTVIENARGGRGDDTMFGNAADNRMIGNSGYDRLSGLIGNDVLSGGLGSDTLTGGAGKDKLSGGSGADKFYYAIKTHGGDTITSFGPSDLLLFKGSAFGKLKAGDLADARFRSNTTGRAGDSDDRFIYRTTDDTLWYDADGKGGTKGLKMADLANDFRLTADDILIV